MADCQVNPEAGCSALRLQLTDILAEQRLQTDHIARTAEHLSEVTFQFKECFVTLQAQALRMQDGAHIMEQNSRDITKLTKALETAKDNMKQDLNDHETAPSRLHIAEEKACKATHYNIRILFRIVFSALIVLFTAFIGLHGSDIVTVIKTGMKLGG